MKLVVENSEAELARKRAMDGVSEVLVELTANLLRVARGAGKPHDIGKQANALVMLFQRHWDACEMYPSSGELAEALSIRKEVRASGRDENDFMQELGEQQVIHAVLQMVASDMLRQTTHYTRARSDLYDGIINIERARENRRKQWAASQRAVPKRAPAKRKAAAKQPRTPRAQAQEPDKT